MSKRFSFQHIRRVKSLKKTRYGYSSKRKFKRIFGEKLYTRVGQYRIKSIAEEVKERYHKRGYNALIVTSSKNYQLWIRKREE